MFNLTKKYLKLKNIIRKHDSAAIAFSGGVDSGLLAKVCCDLLGKSAIAVTGISKTFPAQDLLVSKQIAKKIGIKHIVFNTNEFNNENFLRNGLDRCYWCKQSLFSSIKALAAKYKFNVIFDGTTLSDNDDVRPGNQAKKDFKVNSPLLECKFSKEDVRKLALKLGLDFADKPKGTCLASRIPFGQRVTLKRLKRVSQAEAILADYFGKNTLLRARDHDDLLRIELDQKIWPKKLDSIWADHITKRLKQLGYKYLTIDTGGYIPAGKR